MLSGGGRPAVIRARGLGKVYGSRSRGEVVGLHDLDLDCEGGEVYALLGPNGAGKTTALRILATLIRPTVGEAWVGGHSVIDDPAGARRELGVVSYETRPYDRLTPRETAFFFGRLQDLPDEQIEENLQRVAELLRMEDFLDEPAERLSTGMKQKTVLLRALITEPRILLFDEPTAGLDVITAKGVMDYIRTLRDQGRTILFSTHVLWEAERLADRIGIIDRGRLVAEGSLEALRARTGLSDLEEIFFALVEGP
jgi:sodium transport system ATP-binding protein